MDEILVKLDLINFRRVTNTVFKRKENVSSVIHILFCSSYNIFNRATDIVSVNKDLEL